MNWRPETVAQAVQLLTYWTNSFSSDFAEPTIYKKLQDFLKEEPLRPFGSAISVIQNQLSMTWAKTSCSRLDLLSGAPLKGTHAPIELLSISPIELARQMTILEFYLFQNVESIDLTTTKSRENSPQISEMIQRFNRVSKWVATEVLVTANVKKRAAVIKHFITVAKAASDIRNFNTLLEVTAGLNFSSVQRLRKTWKVYI